ncbi:MAG: PQQ-binding-like beta-propeller repeat protein, partial [Planctomycetota bacterium]|nr:PQQ-binding-like beta-propeller repeat protein [Planctomycetota bacterium]
TGLLLDWPDTGPPVLWSKRLGRSYSPPVVARGALIAFHRIGDEEVLECLDALTGQSRWAFRYPTRYVDRYEYNGGPRSSPAIDGDYVYAYGAEGVLTCLALADGKKVWQRPLNKELEVPQGFFGVGVPPVIEKDIILLNAGGPGGAGVVGINKMTGETLWKTSDQGASYSAPVVCTIGGRRMAVFFTKEGLLVVAPDTGKVLYEMPFRSVYHESVNAASPVIAGDVIFLSAAYYVGSVALQVPPDGPLKCLWRDKKNMQNHWATSIYHDGFLYGFNGRYENEAEMRCLDWKTGEVRWTSPRGLGRATFIMAQGHFIAMGERGDLTLIEVNPDRYVEKKRVRMLDYPCWGPPVLANGLLYIRNETVLLCLDLRGGRR